MLWGFILWSGSHVAANGDVRGLMLFGALGVFAALGILMAERRGRRRLGEAWSGLASKTSVLPLAAIASGRTGFRIDIPMLVAVLVATLATVALLWGGHAALFGADPLIRATS